VFRWLILTVTYFSLTPGRKKSFNLMLFKYELFETEIINQSSGRKKRMKTNHPSDEERIRRTSVGGRMAMEQPDKSSKNTDSKIGVCSNAMGKLFLTFLLLGIFLGGRVGAEDPAKDTKTSGEKIVAKFDKDKDGFLKGNEVPQMLRQRMQRMDGDGDGKLSPQELDRVPERIVQRIIDGASGQGAGERGTMKRGKKPGEKVAPAAMKEFDEQKLKVGDTAPDFELKRRDGNGALKLSSFKGEKPVVLVFGSITCSPFRQKVMGVKPLYEMYGDKAEFVMIYIREAHPESVIQVKEDGKDVLKKFEQTDNFAQRLENAQYCSRLLDLPFPIIVDGDDNKVKEAYAGFPIRLMVVDEKGKIAFDGGTGPKGFQPDKLGDWLAENL